MSEWISVKEQKPPEGWLIIAYRYYADPSILQSDFGLHVDGKFTSGGPIMLERDVTHWMPIPKPPKNTT